MPVFSSQESGVRFWAIFSTIALAIIGLTAGAMLLIAERKVFEFDAETPKMFDVVSSLGITTIAIAWCVYMGAAVIASMYYKTREAYRTLAMAFIFVGLYYLTVMLASLFPWTLCGFTVT